MNRSAVYRRRRLGALLVASVAAWVLYTGAGVGADPAPLVYTVEPGDTLWEMASEHYAPSEDPRENVEAIRRENGLDGYVIRPGMTLRLPR